MENIYVKLEENSWIHKYFEKDMVSVEELIGKIEDLDDELYELRHKYEDFKEEVRDNYEPVKYDPYDYYGVSRDEF